MMRAADVPRSMDRSTRSNLLFIVGDDGNVYVIEQRRERTLRSPTIGSVGVRAAGDL